MEASNSQPHKTRNITPRPSSKNKGENHKPGDLKAFPLMLVLGWASYAAMVIINVSFEALRFGGVTSAEVSNQVFAWFTPAGYAFSIWALIYVVLGIWMVAVTRSIRNFGANEDSALSIFISTNLLNMAWLTLFHLQYIAASVAVIIMLLAAVGLLYYTEHRRQSDMARIVPTSIYFGWISVATVANIAHLIARYANPASPVNEISTMLVVLAVLVVGYALSKIEKDLVYPLVLIWALVGVGVHLLDVSPMTAAAVFAVTAAGAVLIYARASYAATGKIKPGVSKA